MRSQNIRRLVIFFIASILTFVIIFVLWFSRLQALALVHPGRNQPAVTAAEMGLPSQDVTFTTRDGVDISGWYIPPCLASGAAIIYVHGIGGNRGQLLAQAALLYERLGIGALLFDLRNHGQSELAVTTLGLNEVMDVEAAFAWLQMRNDLDPARIGLNGLSMGAATVIRAGARIPEAQFVIAQAAYTSLDDNIAEGVRGLTGLPPFPFAPLLIAFGEAEAGVRIRDVRPIDDVARIAPRPLLLIHGDQDTLVLPRNSEALYAAAGEPKQHYVIAGGGHDDQLQAGGSAFAEMLVAWVGAFNAGEGCQTGA
ncbi:MAG: alpha/beta hydrolase [Chloroflexota bacterium]|nr:alpha/beta hydrolase [Chloroflexota bacterium]